MEEILHNQLRLGSLPHVYPIIYKVLYVLGGCLGFLNHQQYHKIKMVIQNKLDMYNSIDRCMWYI